MPLPPEKFYDPRTGKPHKKATMNKHGIRKLEGQPASLFPNRSCDLFPHQYKKGVCIHCGKTKVVGTPPMP
jgi:hypothetical protein